MEYTTGTTVLMDWVIVGELGQGSYGKVYKVEKREQGLTVPAALKVIRIPRSSEDIWEARSEGMDDQSVTSYFEGIVNRFKNEIAIMSVLKAHPNIVGCEDYKVIPHEGEIGWDILIRMELLTPFKKCLKAPMKEEEVRRLAVDICKALVFCQKKGLIHRDVKPDNIFIDELGSFKLGDFGVARSAEKTMGGMSKQGTENYMAPEVYLGQPYGPTVDIYSLGLTLYRLLNKNRMPFLPLPPNQIEYDDRENSLARRIRGEVLPPPCDASEEFAAIILKACAYNPQERYCTAAEMLEALTGVRAVDTAVDEKGFEQKEVEEFEEEDGSVGTRGVLFHRKRGKAGAEEVLPGVLLGENTIPAAETGDGWSEDGTIGTVGPGFRRRKKDEATGTGIPGNDVVPPEVTPPVATPPGTEIPSETATPPGTVTPPEPEIPSGPETPPEEEKEKSSKRPLLLGGGVAAILALALVVGMPKKESAPPKELQVAETLEEAAAESLEEIRETEVEETSAEEAELAELKKDSLNPDYVSLDETKVLYESVEDAVYVGWNQVNREKLKDQETVMIPVSVYSFENREEFLSRIELFKKRLDVLDTPYAIGYSGGKGEDVAIRISPERMGPLVATLFETEEVLIDMPSYKQVKRLDYQLEDGRWKVTAAINNDNSIQDFLSKQKEVDFELTLRGGRYVNIGSQKGGEIPALSGETLEFAVYLDCFSTEKPQEEYEPILSLMKMTAEHPLEDGMSLYLERAMSVDDTDDFDCKAFDVEKGKNPYQVKYETTEDREMIAALRGVYPNVWCDRADHGFVSMSGGYHNSIEIYLEDMEAAEFADHRQQLERVLKLCETAFEAWDFNSSSYEYMHFHVKSKNFSYYEYELNFEKINEKFHVSSYDDELDKVLQNSGYFADR